MFGTGTGGFGFGAQAQPTPAFGAQPQAAPAFGTFGQQQAPPAFGASTAFGQPAASPTAFGAAAAPSGFGSPAPTAFGAPSAFGKPAATTSTFGQQPTTFGSSLAGTSLFGSPGPASSPGLSFGLSASAATASAFGSPSFGGASTFGAAAQPAAPAGPVHPEQPHAQFGYQTDGSGSRVAPFVANCPPSTKDPTGKDLKQVFRCIVGMTQYSRKSQEELRFEDYAAGTVGLAGAQPYGASPNPNTTPGTGFSPTPASNGFGSTSSTLFGSPQPASTSIFGGSAFGAAKPAASTFGGTSSFGTGGFGTTTSPTTFGAAAPAAQPAFGSSVFGQQAQSSASIFGGAQPAAQPAFGQAQPTFGSSFGSAQPASSPGFGTTFAQPAATPAFGQAQTSSLFGSSTAQPTPSFNSFAQPAAQTSLFGAQPTSSPGFGSPAPATSLFGTTAPATGFGAVAAPTSSLFGAKPASTSIFGSQPAATGFGAAASAPATSLFGSPAPASTSLFGAPAATTSLFGSTGTSLFGQPAPAPAQAAPAGNMFGAAGGVSLFGAQQQPVAPVQPQAQVLAPVQIGVNAYGPLPEVPRYMRPSGLSSAPIGGGYTRPPGPRVSAKACQPVMPRPGKPFRRLPRAVPTLGMDPPPKSAVHSPLTPKHRPSIFKIQHQDPRFLVIDEPFPSADPPVSPPPSPEPSTPYSVHPTSSEITPAPELSTPDVVTRSPTTGPATSSPNLPNVEHLLPILPDGMISYPPFEMLQATALFQPDLLRSIELTLTVPGIGSVKFLQPVDVTGLDISAIVSMGRGEITVYSDDPNSVKKAEVGSGLNVPAEITFYEVDKAMMKSVANCSTLEEKHAKIRAKLQRHCTQRQAQFISYENNGTYKFSVEHFSRWAIPDSDDDDEADAADLSTRASGSKPPGDASYSQAAGAADLVSIADSIGDDNASEGTLHDINQDEDSDHDYDDLDHLDDDDNDTTYRSYPMETPTTSQLPVFPSIFPTDTQHTFASEQLITLATDLKTTQSRTTTTPPPPAQRTLTTWKRYTRPLTRSPFSSDSPPHTTTPTTVLGKLTASPTYLAPSPAPWPHTEVNPPSLSGSAQEYASAVVVDAGLTMGRKFRASWGPSGKLTYPVTLQRGGVMTSKVKVLQLMPGACLLADGQSSNKTVVANMHNYQQRRMEQILTVHNNFKALCAGDPMRDDDADMEAPSSGPNWEFRCTARTVPLEDMLVALLPLAEEVSKGVMDPVRPSADLMDGLEQHDANTWKLVFRLFSQIDSVGGEAVDPSAREGSTGWLLNRAERKRYISQWLEDQVKPEVMDALNNLQPGIQGVQEGILHLLSAHDLNGASELASVSGHPRLATLLCTAGYSPLARSELAAQVTSEAVHGEPALSWKDAGYLNMKPPVIPPLLQRVYEVLSGSLGPSLEFLAQKSQQGSSLTWARCLGLPYWYTSEPQDSLQISLDAYEAQLSASELRLDSDMHVDGDSQCIVACPYPPHLVAAGLAQPTMQTSNWRSITDVQYELMKLSAGMQVSTPGHIEAIIGRPRGCTPDVLDSIVPWLLLCLLRAIDKVPRSEPGDDVSFCPGDVAFATVTMNAAATMQLLGQPFWAVYITLHLPVHCTDGSICHAMRSRKETAVKHILSTCWQKLIENPEQVEFLQSELDVPVAWIAEAEAWSAATLGDAKTEMCALLQAGHSALAQQRLFDKAAPSELLTRDYGPLQLLVEQFGTHLSRPVAALKAYLDLEHRLRQSAAHDHVLCAKTEEDYLVGANLLQLLDEAAAPLQQQIQNGTSSILETDPLARLAMLKRMSTDIATWLLGRPVDSQKIRNVNSHVQGFTMPLALQTYHRVASAAVECA